MCSIRLLCKIVASKAQFSVIHYGVFIPGQVIKKDVHDLPSVKMYRRMY